MYGYDPIDLSTEWVRGQSCLPNVRSIPNSSVPPDKEVRFSSHEKRPALPTIGPVTVKIIIYLTCNPVCKTTERNSPNPWVKTPLLVLNQPEILLSCCLVAVCEALPRVPGISSILTTMGVPSLARELKYGSWMVRESHWFVPGNQASGLKQYLSIRYYFGTRENMADGTAVYVAVCPGIHGLTWGIANRPQDRTLRRPRSLQLTCCRIGCLGSNFCYHLRWFRGIQLASLLWVPCDQLNTKKKEKGLLLDFAQPHHTVR